MMTEQQLYEKRTKIGEDIRAKRLSMNMTQADLAERTGMSTRTIMRLEAGQFWPGLKQYVLIANELGIEV